MNILPAVLFILGIFLQFATSTLSPSDKLKNKPSREIKVKTGPQPENVFDRNLVDDEPIAKDILVENAAYYKDTSTRLFNGTVLGYVTPWNNHGYDVAKIWAQKFDIISPVWLQILRKSENTYELAGTHDIDVGWMNDVKKAAGEKDLKVFPRIMFDKFSETDYSKLLTYESERNAVNKLVLKSCKKYNFDGIVLEVWSQLSARVEDRVLYTLVIEMAQALKEKGYKLILVIPPVRDQTYDLFTMQHFETLYSHVYAFSLMTYDYSSVQRPGANAPLYWMKHAVEQIVPNIAPNNEERRSKILMGLNMYGNDYTPDGGGPITGGQFLDLVKHVKKRLILDDHDVENFFEVKTSSGRHIVFYPTLFSINERIKLANKLNVGLSIWELGQGLDYFYDLF